MSKNFVWTGCCYVERLEWCSSGVLLDFIVVIKQQCSPSSSLFPQQQSHQHPGPHNSCGEILIHPHLCYYCGMISDLLLWSTLIFLQAVVVVCSSSTFSSDPRVSDLFAKCRPNKSTQPGKGNKNNMEYDHHVLVIPNLNLNFTNFSQQKPLLNL